MNVYEIITNQIVEKLEQGTVPWQKPWNSELPKNMVSNKEYRGVNLFLLNMKRFTSPYWLSFKQVNEQGGSVKSGEHGSFVVFYKWVEKAQGDGFIEEFPILRYYKVFNLDQCNGLKFPAPQSKLEFKPIENCENVISAMPNKPGIEYKDSAAYYRPLTDTVNLPNKEMFRSIPEYYSTLFHELTHSTGHKNRLDRNTLTDICPFGSTNYSKEELIAEMGASFLCGHTGIENKTINNSASYIDGWLNRLKNDKRLLLVAAGQAQKAVDYILNKREVK